MPLWSNSLYRLNFEMDAAQYLSLLLVGQPLLGQTQSLQSHQALRQRTAVHYHPEGIPREELDVYLSHQLKAAVITQPLSDDTATQALSQVEPCPGYVRPGSQPFLRFPALC